MKKFKNKTYFVVFVVVLVAAAVFFANNVVETGGLNSITWDEEGIRSSSGEVLVSNDNLPGSVRVSSTSEFGVAGSIDSARLSSDGLWVAFSTSGAVHDAGWLYDVKNEIVKPVAFQYGGGVEVLGWSPDGQFVAFNIGTPAPTEHIKVVRRNEIDGYPPEIGTQLRLSAEDGLTPPFSYEFQEWQAPHTICFSLNEASECRNLTEQ